MVPEGRTKAGAGCPDCACDLSAERVLSLLDQKLHCVGVVISALGILFEHAEGSSGEVAQVSVALKWSMTLLGLMHPFPSCFRGMLTDMTRNASSIEVWSSSGLGSCDRASAA